MVKEDKVSIKELMSDVELEIEIPEITHSSISNKPKIY